MDEQDLITIAEDGVPIVTINGAAALLGVHYSVVQKWVIDDKVGIPYESKGYRSKRYSWERMKEVAAWRQTPNEQAS